MAARAGGATLVAGGQPSAHARTALTGETTVAADGTLLVTVTRLWPAEAAIGLTAAVVAASTARLLTAAAGRREAA